MQVPKIETEVNETETRQRTLAGYVEKAGLYIQVIAYGLIILVCIDHLGVVRYRQEAIIWRMRAEARAEKKSEKNWENAETEVEPFYMEIVAKRKDHDTAYHDLSPDGKKQAVADYLKWETDYLKRVKRKATKETYSTLIHKLKIRDITFLGSPRGLPLDREYTE